MSLLRSLGLGFVLALCAGGAQASSVLFTITDVGGGQTGPTTPTGINKNGQVVGYVTTAAGPHAFVYDDSATTKFKDLQTTVPAGTPLISQAYAINDSGLIVGNYSGSHVFTDNAGVVTSPLTGSANAVNAGGFFVGKNSAGLAYKSDGTTTTALSLTGSTGGEGKGINTAGDIVGTATVGGVPTAFVLSHTGTLTYLPIPAGHANLVSSGALGISDNGVVTGFFTDNTGKGWAFMYKMGDANAVLLEDGTTIPSISKSANTSGKIVGSYTVTGVQHGFIYVPGEGMLDLNNELAPYAKVPGLIITDAVGINDSTAIAATAVLNGGRPFAVRLNWVPLPNSALMGFGLLACICTIGIVRRLRAQ